MTGKQIIIDGIDVSGCVYYQYNMCAATKDNYGDCSLYCKDYEMKYCHYKQLKRKEQECEELKEEIDDLKEIIQRHDNDNNALLSEFEDDLVDYYRRYKECLTEIEEIAGEDFNHTCWEAYAIQLKKILQKISECKGEYNEKIR